MKTVACEIEAEVAWIRLDDPERLNAMGEAMAADFRELLADLHGRSLRAAVISGAGRSFSAGGDRAMLREKAERPPEVNQRDMLTFYSSFLGLLELQIPLVSAVHGWAVGAGCCLAAACDVRLADPGARFRVPFLRMGLFPGMGSTYWFSRRMGPWGDDFLLSGRTLDAQQALARGLVTDISAPEGVMELARQTVEGLLLNGPETTRDLLQVLRGNPEELARALAREAELQAHSYARSEFLDRL